MLQTVSKVRSKTQTKVKTPVLTEDDWKLTYAIVPLKHIVVYKVRKPDPDQVRAYIDQIVNSDRVEPILVDKNMHLLDGQCRYAAYEAIGFVGLAVTIAEFPAVANDNIRFDGNAHRDKMARKKAIIERKRKK